MSNIQGMTVAQRRISRRILVVKARIRENEARWRVLDEQQREIFERIGVWKARLSVLSRKLRDAKPEENKRRR